MGRRVNEDRDIGHEQYLFPLARRRELAREKRRQQAKLRRPEECRKNKTEH